MILIRESLLSEKFRTPNRNIHNLDCENSYRKYSVFAVIGLQINIKLKDNLIWPVSIWKPFWVKIFLQRNPFPEHLSIFLGIHSIASLPGLYLIWFSLVLLSEWLLILTGTTSTLRINCVISIGIGEWFHRRKVNAPKSFLDNAVNLNFMMNSFLRLKYPYDMDACSLRKIRYSKYLFETNSYLQGEPIGHLRSNIGRKWFILPEMLSYFTRNLISTFSPSAHLIFRRIWWDFVTTWGSSHPFGQLRVKKRFKYLKLGDLQKMESATKWNFWKLIEFRLQSLWIALYYSL